MNSIKVVCAGCTCRSSHAKTPQVYAPVGFTSHEWRSQKRRRKAPVQGRNYMQHWAAGMTQRVGQQVIRCHGTQASESADDQPMQTPYELTLGFSWGCATVRVTTGQVTAA